MRRRTSRPISSWAASGRVCALCIASCSVAECMGHSIAQSVLHAMKTSCTATIGSARYSLLLFLPSQPTPQSPHAWLRCPGLSVHHDSQRGPGFCRLMAIVHLRTARGTTDDLRRVRLGNCVAHHL